MTIRPTALPARAHFSSGPCAKRPGWNASQLATESLGRSHRSKIGKARLKLAIDLTREILGVPSTHRHATSASPGTAPHPASACQMVTGSATTEKG